jgi:hypothetical protein
MINGYRPKKQPESVKDCIDYLQIDSLSSSKIENSSYYTQHFAPNTHLKDSKMIFGLSTDSLNRKGGNLFFDNSKVEDIMTPKSSEMNCLSAEDMKLQRTREEVSSIDKRAS